MPNNIHSASYKSNQFGPQNNFQQNINSNEEWNRKIKNHEVVTDDSSESTKNLALIEDTHIYGYALNDSYYVVNVQTTTGEKDSYIMNKDYFNIVYLASDNTELKDIKSEEDLKQVLGIQ